jgi:predicted nucleic acid-binding protein
MVVALDSTPLGTISNPKVTEENLACQQWLKNLVAHEIRVIHPEITDYEVRRELVRAGKTKGIERLDNVKQAIEYLPITTEAMLLAAELWAKARKEGYQTASDKAIDGDVILVAQLLTSGIPESEIVVATDNVGHLGHFLTAKEWQDITL